MRVVVIGAGYMGSAMAVIARNRGHDVALVGTWLDDDFVDAAAVGRPHPRLRLMISGVVHARFQEARELLAGADLVCMAATSDGVLPVLERVADFIPDGAAIGCVSKGFVENALGRETTLSSAVRECFGGRFDRRWVAFGGPAKAMEVARGVPTTFVFGSRDAGAAALAARLLRGGNVFVETTDDIVGVECSMALKNAYATAGGLWDGLCARGLVEGGAAHNAKAMLFAVAIGEMAAITRTVGGLTETVFGMAGVGDLHVTFAGGRNRAYGEAVGLGGNPSAVAAEMAARGELTEGYPAIQTAWRLVRELDIAARSPLLRALFEVVYEGVAVEEVFSNLGWNSDGQFPG